MLLPAVVFGPSPKTAPSLSHLKLTVSWRAALQLLFVCEGLQDHRLFFLIYSSINLDGLNLNQLHVLCSN